MFFSNNFISRKMVFLWFVLVSTTVLSNELVQRSNKVERERVALNAAYLFDQARNYNAGELRAVGVKKSMLTPLNQTF